MKSNNYGFFYDKNIQRVLKLLQYKGILMNRFPERHLPKSFIWINPYEEDGLSLPMNTVVNDYLI